MTVPKHSRKWYSPGSARHLQSTERPRRFFQEVDRSPSAVLGVVLGGVEHCTSDYLNDRQGFPYLCIEFIALGKGALTLKGKEYRLSPGTLFCYGPGLPHRIRNTDKKPLKKYFVAFYGTQAKALLKQTQLEPGEIAQLKNSQSFLAIIDELVTQGCAQEKHSREICISLLSVLLQIIQDQRIAYGGGPSKALASYQRCCSLIETHFLDLHRLKDLTELCGLEPAYLCRLFQRFNRVTPYQALVRAKMRYAALLLHEGDLLVKEVAERVHFNDPYQFARLFKQTMGLAPGEYARRMKGNPAVP